MNRKLENKMNCLSGKLDVLNSLANSLIDSMCFSGNLTERDSKNLAQLLQNRIKDVKFRYEQIMQELKI